MYVAGAKIFTYYHDNPYIVYPSEYNWDSDVSGAYSHTYIYGPVWLYLSAFLNYLSGMENRDLNVLLIKTMQALFNVLNSLLVYDISKRLGKDKATRGMLFYAWNPPVIIETAGMGHNDAVLVCFLLLFINA